ncbi:MAG: hypothetical protein JW852_08225, partial [Spirochaetales bacterium]|nr:hypothetical protein [Spirochaetales bacterium]
MAVIAAAIDPTGLSVAGRKALAYVTEKLTAADAVYNEGAFSFDASPALTVESFFHLPVVDSTESLPEAYDWIHGYEERKPFLHIPLEFWYGDSLYLTSELEAKEEHRTVTSPSTPDVAHNHLNVLLDDPNIRIDLYFPFRAVLSTGGEWWNLAIGRDKLSWGGGVSGNLMLSDYSDFYDFVGLSFMSRSFKMTNIYAVTDRFRPDGSNIEFSGFIGHRLEMRFFEKLKFTVNESVTFAKLPPVLVRDLNFLMVFHNWMDPDRFNSLLSVELEYTPWRYFTFYGHLAMDEFAVKYEIDRGGGGGPPIYGYMAGVKGAYPLGEGYLNGACEWAQTSPWLYNRRAAPYFYNVRRYWSLVTDRFEFITKPLGYVYGPDAILFLLTASYLVPDSFSAGIEVKRMIKGEMEAGSPWDPAPGDAPPTGIPEKKWIVSLNGAWKPLVYLEVGGGLNWIQTANPEHLDGERRSDLELTAFASIGM